MPLGGFGGRGGSGPARFVHREQLEALAGIERSDRPLLSRLLRAQELRARFLACLNDIATRWLVWDQLGPVAEKYHKLIADDVKRDTHKAASYEHFVQNMGQMTADNSGAEPSLKTFVRLRHDYLLDDEYVKKYGEN